MKATKTLALIVFSYSLFWAPVCINDILETAKLVDTNTVLSLYSLVSHILLMWGTLNSGVNCVIYALFNKDFRKAYYHIILCGKRSRTLVNADSVTQTVD